MPKNNNIYEIDLTSLTSDAITLPTNEGISLYLITGTVDFSEITDNITISSTGLAAMGMQYTFSKPANITIGGSFSLEIFGRLLTSTEASEPALITCIYNGASWDVYLAN